MSHKFGTADIEKASQPASTLIKGYTFAYGPVVLRGEKRLLVFKEESSFKHSNYPNFKLKLVLVKWEFLLCCAGQLLLLCALSLPDNTLLTLL